MKKCLSFLMALLLMLSAVVFVQPAVQAESMYIIADSDKRELTREELWGYKYDTLLYAFNEI